MTAPALHHALGDGLPDLREDGQAVRTFVGRLPDPVEVIRWGGLPGCQYAFVSDRKLGAYRRAGWTLARGTDSTLLVVEGPKGSCDIFVLVAGKPVHAADPSNGVRLWHYDPDILETTGLTEPYPKNPQRAPNRPRAGTPTPAPK